MAESRKKKFIQRLNYKLRLVLINDENFEEKFSFKLTPLNVFGAFSSFIVLFATILILGIFYTPLREYVPGYTDTETKARVQQLLFKTDSLEQILHARDIYDQNITGILSGGNGLANEGDTIQPKK